MHRIDFRSTTCIVKWKTISREKSNVHDYMLHRMSNNRTTIGFQKHGAYHDYAYDFQKYEVQIK